MLKYVFNTQSQASDLTGVILLVGVETWDSVSIFCVISIPTQAPKVTKWVSYFLPCSLTPPPGRTILLATWPGTMSRETKKFASRTPKALMYAESHLAACCAVPLYFPSVLEARAQPAAGAEG